MSLRSKNFIVGILAVALCLMVWRLRPVKPTLSALEPTVPDQVEAAARLLMRPLWAVDRARKLSKAAAAANVPIEFYGKMVDQYDQPVEGVRIEAIVSGWNILGLMQHDSRVKTNTLYSDLQGKFVVSGMSGESLWFHFEKDGYELAPGSLGGYGYGPGVSIHHEPDPANPVVYHMWKRLGAAEMIGQGFDKTVRADGTPISIDLVTGEFVIGATNLPGPTVRVWREPFIYDPQKSLPEAWRYELVWPGGKVQATDDVFCYLAPQDGYKEKLEVSIHKGDPNFRFRDKCSFYFVNQQGQYGRGTIEIWADYTEEKVLASLSVCWNPDGSRNLEPKPE